MTEKARNFLEKAGVTALGVPAAMMAGEMISDLREEAAGGGSESKAKPLNYKAGGSVKSASARADGCAIRGKTRA
jgi:hypothetical protein